MHTEYYANWCTYIVQCLSFISYSLTGSNDYLVLVVSVVPAAVVLLTLLLLVALVVCCILYKRAGNKGTTLHSQVSLNCLMAVELTYFTSVHINLVCVGF